MARGPRRVSRRDDERAVVVTTPWLSRMVFLALAGAALCLHSATYRQVPLAVGALSAPPGAAVGGYGGQGGQGGFGGAALDKMHPLFLVGSLLWAAARTRMGVQSPETVSSPPPLATALATSSYASDTLVARAGQQLWPPPGRTSSSSSSSSGTGNENSAGFTPSNRRTMWSSGNVTSIVRVRRGGSYDGQPSGPVLDFKSVAVGKGTVHVFLDASDAESRAAVAALAQHQAAPSVVFNGGSGGGGGDGPRLTGAALRTTARELARGLKVQLHEGPMPKGFCAEGPAAADEAPAPPVRGSGGIRRSDGYGDCAVFVVRPWFWHNMYHLVNDASMLAHHVASTPAAFHVAGGATRGNRNSSSSSSPGGGSDLVPRLLVFGKLPQFAEEATGAAGPVSSFSGRSGADGGSSGSTGYGYLQGWTEVLLGSSLFPGGLRSAAPFFFGTEGGGAGGGGEGSGGSDNGSEEEKEMPRRRKWRRREEGAVHPPSSSQRPHCVGSLHWGAPLRVLSANGVRLTERRASQRSLRAVVQASCPPLRQHHSLGGERRRLATMGTSAENATARSLSSSSSLLLRRELRASEPPRQVSPERGRGLTAAAARWWEGLGSGSSGGSGGSGGGGSGGSGGSGRADYGEVFSGAVAPGVPRAIFVVRDAPELKVSAGRAAALAAANGGASSDGRANGRAGGGFSGLEAASAVANSGNRRWLDAGSLAGLRAAFAASGSAKRSGKKSGRGGGSGGDGRGGAGGVELVPCCDWAALPACVVARAFLEADIVVGLHGAGLVNAALAKQGAVSRASERAQCRCRKRGVSVRGLGNRERAAGV